MVQSGFVPGEQGPRAEVGAGSSGSDGGGGDCRHKQAAGARKRGWAGVCPLGSAAAALSLPPSFPPFGLPRARPAPCLRDLAHGAPRLSRRRQGPLRRPPGARRSGAARPPSAEPPPLLARAGRNTWLRSCERIRWTWTRTSRRRWPRSCTWPLPQPDLVGDEDEALGSGVAEGAEDCGLERRATAPPMAPAPPLGAEVGPLRESEELPAERVGEPVPTPTSSPKPSGRPRTTRSRRSLTGWSFVPYFKDKATATARPAGRWGRPAGEGC